MAKDKSSINYNLTPKNLHLQTEEEMEPLEEVAIHHLAHHVENKTEYMKLLEILGLTEALGRVHERRTLRSV
jgi:hypothetical protein